MTIHLTYMWQNYRVIIAPHSTYTTSDLRRTEVIDEAFTRPVSVRDGKTGDLLLMVPQSLINHSNEVARYAQLFTRVVVECQRPDPSAVNLDKASYLVNFTPEQRQQFVREFAEALSTSLAEDDPSAVRDYIEFMSHASTPILPQFHSSFLDGEWEILQAHMSSR